MFDQLKGELDQAPQIDSTTSLNMTSLLTFPAELRQFMTWIMRQKTVQVSKVAQYFGQEEPAAQELLELMVKKGLIEEVQSAEGMNYQVPVRSSRNYRVPDRVWKAINE